MATAGATAAGAPAGAGGRCDWMADGFVYARRGYSGRREAAVPPSTGPCFSWHIQGAWIFQVLLDKNKQPSPALAAPQLRTIFPKNTCASAEDAGQCDLGTQRRIFAAADNA
ncbi:hypothetical protein F4860DRAFT_509766 [Xylaria cubensis]|nr:hypothetical protein F4860DRAFT_509766 [Xylaria cubensis]